MKPLSKKYYRFSRLQSRALLEVQRTTGQSDPGTSTDTRPDISRRIIESGTLMDKMVRDVAYGIPASETKFKAVLRTYIEACQEQAETNPFYKRTAEDYGVNSAKVLMETRRRTHKKGEHLRQSLNTFEEI